MIPVNSFNLNGNELKYLKECITSGWISSEGPYVKEFETKFSNYIGVKHGVAVSNGSAALDIAVKALDIGPGDEVIVPTFTIISPVQSIVTAGAKPVLVDVNPSTWNMDTDKVEDKITNKTKAILVVHMYGIPTDMDPILALCKKYNLKLIEDAAEVHGQTYNNKMCGSFGDVSIFSFYPNKHITTGEGGMVLTKHDEINDKCRKLRNLCFEPNKRRFVHYELGWNYRMTNLQAALGVAQLENIDNHINRKREIGKMYQEGFSGLNGFQKPTIKTSYSKNIYWVFGLVAENEKLYNDALEILKKNKIGTRPFFWSMHEQPVFKVKGLFENENYPVAERISRLGFYIPSGIGLTNEQVQIVIQTLLKVNNEL